MSSDWGLNEQPSTPTVRPSGDPPAISSARSTMRARRRRLIASTSPSQELTESTPSSRAVAAKARMSLGRQPPPNPSPGTRNRPPIRLSWASASASGTMSAPAASQTSAIALMNETLVARNALAATLTSSAVGRSVTRNGTPAASGRGVHLAQQGLGPLRGDPGHDPVRLHGVGHGVALAQELGVPGQLGRGADRGEPGQALGQQRGGADRDRGFPDDQAGPGQPGRQGLDARLQVRQVGRGGVGPLRGAHAHEVDVTELRDLGVAGGEAQPARVQAAAQQVLEAGLVERQAARGQRLELGLVRVQAEDLESELGQARGVGRTQVPGAENGDTRHHCPSGGQGCRRGGTPCAVPSDATEAAARSPVLPQPAAPTRHEPLKRDTRVKHKTSPDQRDVALVWPIPKFCRLVTLGLVMPATRCTYPPGSGSRTDRPSENQTSISRLASSRFADACTRFATGSLLALAYALLWWA